MRKANLNAMELLSPLRCFDPTLEPGTYCASSPGTCAGQRRIQRIVLWRDCLACSVDCRNNALPDWARRVSRSSDDYCCSLCAFGWVNDGDGGTQGQMSLV